MIVSKRFVLVFLLILAASAAASAQSLQTGTIEGRVTDQTGAVIPGATVTLTSPVLVSPRVGVTDAAGVYIFPSLPLGDYSAEYELAGFRKVRHEGLVVTAARTLTIDVTLQTGQVSETLTVVGETPTVDVTATNVATSIDAATLQSVPTARDVWAILQNLAPQVVLDREDVGGSQGGLQAVFSTFGSTWHQNTYALNGVNVTDPSATGAAGFYYDYDSFQETQVSTAQHSAEIGTPGVYYNIIVKSGTDKFRGGSAYYFENSSMVSDNLTDELKAQGVASGSSINLFSDWTGQLGGPLAKDKLRFFTSWRDWRIHRNVVDFPKSENTDMFSGLGNVTYQIDPRQRITGLYTRQTYWKPNRNASALIQPDSTWIEDDVFTIYQGAYNSQISNDSVLDARVSYSTVTFPLKFQPGVDSPNITDLATGKQSGVATTSYDQWRTRLAIDGALTSVKHWGNLNHNIKVGYEFFRGLSDAGTDVLDAINLTVNKGVPNTVTQFNTPFREIEEFRGSVIHAQDNIAFGKVTLNLGLRYEHTGGIVPAQSAPGGPYSVPRSFPEQTPFTWNTVAPRLGIVYDPLPTHTVAVKAGYSRYYHAVGTGYISAVNPNNQGGTVFDWNDLNGDGKFEPGEEGKKLSSFGGTITSIDPNFKQPYTDEIAAGVDFETLNRVRFSAQYIHRHAKDLGAVTNPGVPFDAGYIPTQALDPVTGSLFTLYNERPEFLGADRYLQTNPSDFTTTFNGFQLTAQRRFSQGYQFLTSYAYSKSDITRAGVSVSPFGGAEEEGAGGIGYSPGSAFLNPNQLINNTSGAQFFDRPHVFKIAGSYDLAKPGITLAATGKIQSGTPYGRILTVSQDVTGTDFNQGAITFFAEPRDSHRFPTIKTMDFRISKFFLINQQRFEVMGDFFNLFNVSTVTNVNANSGSDFGKPIDILGPRVFRIGGRWTF